MESEPYEPWSKIHGVTRVRNICVLLISCDTLEDILQDMQRWSVVSFAVIAQTGNDMIQGYMEFSSQVKFDTLTSRFPNSWFRYRQGSARQAAQEITEAGDALSFGKITGQGRRSGSTSVAQQGQEEHIEVSEASAPFDGHRKPKRWKSLGPPQAPHEIREARDAVSNVRITGQGLRSESSSVAHLSQEEHIEGTAGANQDICVASPPIDGHRKSKRWKSLRR